MSSQKIASLFVLEPESNLVRVGETLTVQGIEQFKVTREAFLEVTDFPDPYFFPMVGEHFFGSPGKPGKTEKVPETTLVAHELTRWPTEIDLGQEFGESLETTFWHLLNAIKAQAKGEPGILQVKDFPDTAGNLFAIFDRSYQELWMVQARWRPHYPCWGISAHLAHTVQGFQRNFRILTRQPPPK